MTTTVRIGRPLKAATPGNKVSLGLRVTGEIKAKLDAAAVASGRTQSQEAERRLEASFSNVAQRAAREVLTETLGDRDMRRATLAAVPGFLEAGPGVMKDPVAYATAMSRAVGALWRHRAPGTADDDRRAWLLLLGTVQGLEPKTKGEAK